MKRFLKVLIFFVLLVAVLFFFAVPPAADRLSNRVLGEVHNSFSPQVKDLHSRLWIADLHADALLWNRNLLKRNDHGHVDIPRLIEGNTALQAFTVVSKTPFGLNFQRNDDDSDLIAFLVAAQRWPIRTWFSLTERALYQAQKLDRFAEQSNGTLFVIRSKADLLEYVDRRKQNPGITAGLLGIEGAHVLEGKVENVHVLFDAGFRMMSPSHFFDTEVAGSAHGIRKGGLTRLGSKVIAKMEALGMIVDLAHASPKTIEDVLAQADRPVLISHTGVKGTCDNIRNLSDQHLAGIAATGGVIGIAFFPQAVCGDSVADIVRAIEYAVAQVGVDHVALGSDFDGAVKTPIDAANMIALTAALVDAGFSFEDLRKIMGGNVRRVLLEVLPE